VPWSFKPGNTVLERKIPSFAGPAVYLRHLAAARVYLDNFDHVQASWFSEGKKTGQVALHYGADDFGGTLLEEHVHQEAGFVNTTTADETVRIIQGAGFVAVQRDTLYRALRRFEAVPAR
ncbi:MAG: dehypoxanthine futalosine cyclase, partial [bacterium]